MLTQPVWRYFSQFRVSAYQDDTMFWKFYLIPDYLSIRRDVQGNPVFLLIKYAFGDQDRAEDPALPRGGGYMTFDVEMSVPEADNAQIVAQLQKDVNDIWNQLKAFAEQGGHSVQGMRLKSHHSLPGRVSWFDDDIVPMLPGAMDTSASMGVPDVLLGLGPEGPGAPPGDKPPAVIIGQPTWTEGTFKVNAPQSEGLISHRMAEGKASLLGNNVISANMDLTAAGATFMEKTLTNLDGSGATDLTPISVAYELKFLARVPPVKLDIRADVRSLHQSILQISHDYDDGCDEDTITHSEHQLEMAIQSGLVEVKLDPSINMPDDLIQEMRSNAMTLVMDMIKNAFLDKKPAEEKKPGNDFTTREGDVYYAKSEMNYASTHFEYHEQIQSLQHWPANPQGTLQTFLAGVSAADMKKYVRVVDLDDDFFKTLGLRATCFADWDEPIAFVEAQVRYQGKDENNLDVEKVQTFTFTKDHTTDLWDVSLIGKKREYTYRWRIAFRGREAGEFTRWERDTSPHLNISIADPGKIAIKVLVGNIDFGQITKTVQVDLKYSDSGSDVDEETTTMVLANGQMEQNYQRYIYTDWDRPVKYRTRFFLKNDQTIEGEWQDTLNRQLLINEPTSYNRLDVQLVPAGEWDNVIQSVINLRYTDQLNGYYSEGIFSLKTPDEFRAWAVVLKDAKKRKFEYKVLTSFKDGSPPADSGWITGEGDQSVAIVVRQSPHLKVKLLPNLIDFKVTPIVQTTLHYDDPNGDMHKVETFPFTAVTDAVWSFPIANDKQRSYRYQTTYSTVDGQTVALPEVSTDETALVIQKLLVPEVTCLMVPKLVNFVQTPVVQVDVEYQDPAHSIDYSDTLIFTEPTAQSIRVPVQKDSPRDYKLSVTYFLSDGTIARREPVVLDQPKIVIPMYVAGS